MATAHIETESTYFVLAAWCTAAKAWHDFSTRHHSVQAAEATATERGNYRVGFICDGRRVDLEPFAIVGDD